MQIVVKVCPPFPQITKTGDILPCNDLGNRHPDFVEVSLLKLCNQSGVEGVFPGSVSNFRDLIDPIKSGLVIDATITVYAMAQERAYSVDVHRHRNAEGIVR